MEIGRLAGAEFSAAEERARLARESRGLLIAWLASLAVVFGGALAWIEVVRPDNARWIWLEIALLATFPGKYLIFAGLSGDTPLRPHEIAVLAVFVDLATALTIAVGLGLLLRIDWIARTLYRARAHVVEVLKEFPRLKRMAFFGVVLFVFLPLPASGSIGGSFVGQIVGLSRTATVVAVTIGGALVSAVFTALCVLFGQRGKAMIESPWVTAGSALVFLVFAYWAWRKVKRTLQSSA